MPSVLRKQGSVAIIQVDGKLALGENLEEFRAKWVDALASGSRDIIVNLERVTMVDSSGIGTLIRCHSAAISAGGRLKLVGAAESVRHSLRITRLERVFDFSDTEAGALAALGASGTTAR